MTWKPIQLRGLSFLNHKEPALLEFQSGLNIICGASDTGKSFVLEAIDFLLGSGTPLRDIPERVGYDRARIVLKTADEEIFTLERSTGGGNFSLFKENILSGEPTSEARTIRVNPLPGTNESLSTFLLSLIGLANKYLQKNRQGETKRLGFRDLVKMILIKEDAIIKRNSPILTGQLIFQTAEYSLFKLLLTGVDASGLRAEAEREAELTNSLQTNNTKAAFIDELLAESRRELSDQGVSQIEAEEKLAGLEKEIETQQDALARMQGALDERVEKRRLLVGELSKITGRIEEIDGLLARFDLLKTHYRVDLERLAAIEESGSLFVHLEQKPCPLCGAIPENQHLDEECDGNVEGVIRSAAAESVKVEKLSRELDQTINELQAESSKLNSQKARLQPEYQEINQEIDSIVSPFKDAQNTFSELVRQSSEIQRLIDRFKRIEDLESRKSSLLSSDGNPPVELASSDSAQVDLSASVLDDFAQKVQQLLQTWHFPGSDRVHFDETAKDLVIGGQPRTSRGKGFRAITHAAVTIGLMEFCKDRNLAHPGFVILDSPLLAYYEPEGVEDSLVGTDLKVRFYEYLASNHSDSQLIIIENEHPPSDIQGNFAITDFTKNPHEGRYGFFPHAE